MTDQLDRLSTALADRYRIERELGEGGMATVYLAEDQINSPGTLEHARCRRANTAGEREYALHCWAAWNGSL